MWKKYAAAVLLGLVWVGARPVSAQQMPAALVADPPPDKQHPPGLAIPTVQSHGVQAGSPESDVREALAKFIHAFDNLDWEVFRLAFADDATVFYPRAFPKRANGRSEFEKTFKTVFEQIRGGRTAAPYMDIQPKDIEIQMFGDIAIATFHLDDRPGFLNRRTIVLNKTPAGWKIVHLHASEVPVLGNEM